MKIFKDNCFVVVKKEGTDLQLVRAQASGGCTVVPSIVEASKFHDKKNASNLANTDDTLSVYLVTEEEVIHDENDDLISIKILMSKV